MSTYTDITEDYSSFDDLSNDRHNSLPLKTQDNFSFYKILAICCSLIVFQVAYSIEFSIITPILTNYHIPHAIICISWMFVSIMNLFVHPMIMYYSNITNTHFGKRRPFILTGGIFILMSFISLFLISGYSVKRNNESKMIERLIIAALLLSFLILHLSIKMVQVPSYLLFNEIIPKNNQKYTKSMGSIISSFTITIIYIIGGFELAQYLPKSRKDNSTIFTNDQFLLMICFLVVLIALIFTLSSSKEEIISDSILKEYTNPFKEIQQVLSSRPKSIIWICVIYICSWMAYYPFIVFITNYFGFAIHLSKTDENSSITIDEHGKSFGMLILALSQIFELMTTFIVPKIIAKINMKRTYAISMSFLTVLLIISGFIKNKFALMGIYSLIGICPAVFKTIPYLLIQIIVPDEQLSIHRNILNSSASIGKMLSMLLIGIFVSFAKLDDRIIIASGAFFAFISAILCYWMILPFKPIELNQVFIQSDQNHKNIFN